MSRARDVLLMAVIGLYALVTATRLLSMITGGARVHRVSSKGKGVDGLAQWRAGSAM
jgi:hypothetical protein